MVNMWKIRTFTVVLGFSLTIHPAVALADTTDRLAEAAATIEEVTKIPDKGIPKALLERAHCVVAVPSLKKGAFVVGGEYGRGFASCRAQARWSAPAGIRIEGGSFGLQIGGSETEVVMLVMNKKGMDRLLSTKFTLGGEASVAAGPVGRSAEAKTDAAMTAEILAYSRARGVFAGIALEGSTLREDEDANRELYGKAVTNREILSGDVPAPASAARLLAAIKHSAGPGVSGQGSR